MDDPTLFRLIGVALFLFFLLILAYYIARRGKPGSIHANKRQTQRMNILETRMIDQKRQISLISIDRKEYVILAGLTGESIILHKEQEDQPTHSIQGGFPPPLNAHFGTGQ